MKAPAFQFYPKDWDADENVIPMSYEEEGVYFALCRRYWLAGNTLPSDLERLRRLLKGRPTLAKMRRWWETIGACFQVEGDKLTHKRLDREREQQAENRERKRRAGEARAAQVAAQRQQDASRPPAEGQLKPSPTSSSASSPSTTSATAVSREKGPARSEGAAGGSYLNQSRTVWSHPKGYSLYRGKHYDDLVARFDGEPEKLHAWLEAQVENETERIGNFLRFIDERLDAEKTPRDRPFTAAERQHAERTRKSCGRCMHDPPCDSYAECLTALMRDCRGKAKAS